ncbi:MAG: ATP-binding cassette domain-containing protein [Lentisphaeria bacterium]|nr:ATP-binding cassette domain-containing protein [Lentisphaeria bacterium]MDY0177034.1 ATP-binding cassette domain-containing protein [Lentisphaeria bacterium]NLZ60404.1 ATP-binding cassette domain-containing protein [Lentisphaerota bacterium]
MIKTIEVQKSFGSSLAVDRVSFEVKKGEVLGFLGPNGAGKSTTMRMITGFLPLSGGKILIGGHDIEEQPLQAKRLMGYLPENAPAYADMSVLGFLRFIAKIRGLKAVEAEAAVEKAIATCHLEKVRFQIIDTLSKGYLHRVCFAQAILHDPPILILDEPTDGLDPNQKHEMRQLIKEMGKHKAIIVSTHILEEVEAICTRVIIIDQGKLVFNGSPDELLAQSPQSGQISLRVLGRKPEELREKLKDLPGLGTVSIKEEKDGALAATLSAKAEKSLPAARVARLMQEANWEFDQLYTSKGRLDDVFRRITSLDSAEEVAK